MTDAEKALWRVLRDKQFHDLRFRRQHPIDLYVVDFYCASKQVVIEIDGGQHTSEGDAERMALLERKGLRVIRFWNNEVLENLDGVIRGLEVELDLEQSPPCPSPF